MCENCTQHYARQCAHCATLSIITCSNASKCAACALMLTSLGQSHEVFHWWVQLELSFPTHDVLGCCLACHAAEDDAVQERIATQAIIAVNSSCNLTSSVHSRNHLSLRVNALS